MSGGPLNLASRYFFDLLSRKEVETLTAVFDRVLAKLAADDGSTT